MTELTASHVNNSIARALRGESHLDPEVLKIGGFSTSTMRHLFNCLCQLEGKTFLEVGVFQGASLIAAFNNTPIAAFGIDNFSQDFSQGDIRAQFYANLEKWKHTASFVRFIEGDCFELAEDAYGDKRIQIDLLSYDGHHDTLPTSKALPAFFDLLADTFIYIVDDAHWSTVAAGVTMGFETLAGRVKIEQEWKLSGKKRQDDPIFWNGVAIFLCEKIK